MKENRIKRLIKTSLCIVTAAILLYSCASVGNINGGEKDIDYPVMVKSKPELYATNYDGKKVKMKFNEFFTLDNIETKFLMSPPQKSVKAKIKLRGKKIIVKFKEPLPVDTTITLQFFDAIKDFNEGNVNPDFQFAFSTGAVCDSFAISGYVYDAETLAHENGMLVGLYHDFSDSITIKNKPDYITRTDSLGYFSINNVRNGKYKIFAMQDINETQRFDLENEKIAFLKSPLITQAVPMHKEDTVKAGTVIHKGTKGREIADTLKNDTLVIQDILYTTPNNVSLMSFFEIRQVQYITERNRDMRMRALLVFNKNIDDSVKITYVDDTLKVPNIYREFNKRRDTLTLWFTDTSDYKCDTLQYRVSFKTLDSLRNPVWETDTIPLKFSSKKIAKKADAKNQKPKGDANIDSLRFKIQFDPSKDLDINSNITLKIPMPVSKIDTSLIKLYELKDSSFTEDMNQKLLKAVRHDSANFLFVFKQPVICNVIFNPTDSTAAPNWCTISYSPRRDSVRINITDTCWQKKEGFRTLLKHQSNFYAGQIQSFRDSVNTKIVNQKLLSYSRPSRDSLLFTLEKTPAEDIEILPINFTPTDKDNWMKLNRNNDKITVVFTDTSAINKDTLAIRISTFDRKIKSKDGKKLMNLIFKDTLYPIFRPKKQNIVSVSRLTKDTAVIAFMIPCGRDPQISGINVSKRDGFSQSLSKNRDSVTIVFNNEILSDTDTLIYAVSYDNYDRLNNPVEKTDTVTMIKPVQKEQKKVENDRRRRSNLGKQAEQERKEKEKDMFKATLKFPVDYSLEVDTNNYRNRKINFKVKPGVQYMIMADDSALTSIFNTPNSYYETTLMARDLDYYGEFRINIQNCGNIDRYPDITEDTPPFVQPDTSSIRTKRKVERDTTPISATSISTGSLLIQLCTEKGMIVRQVEITADQTIKFEFLEPGDYTVKAVRNLNNDKIWNTGNYLEGKYPEKVFQYPYKQTVKSKWITETSWKF